MMPENAQPEPATPDGKQPSGAGAPESASGSAPEAAPLVWTVIATYQAEPWLERCLDSCRRSSVPTRVVIIDNASSDRSVEIAREFEATCFPQERNLGFGVANNLGLHHAREHGAEWVLLLNQDAFLAEETLARMLDVASRRTGTSFWYSPDS